MSLRLTILGSGTSHGVPMIGCDCPVCSSPDPRDRRTRCSAVFSWADGAALIDTSPELRLQCVSAGVTRVDAVFFTHYHADHVVGLDDLRRFNALQGRELPIHADAATLSRLRRMFDYAFTTDPEYPSAKPDLRAVELSSPVKVSGRTVTPIPYFHGKLPVFGFRVGSIAYCPDCSAIPDESRPLLAGLDVLVLGALRHRPHPTHFTLAQAVDEALRIGARRTWFTHIAHELPHGQTCDELPSGMALAHDGLVIESA
ncbi:MAG: MBL fold metallo-hydrolase [Phycisphaerales bacterium]|nr:MBL fold metallo-hydrolase [Phycisphaerales bacterium]